MIDARLLSRLADAVSDADWPGSIYEPAIDAVMAATGAHRAGILLFDDEGVLRFRAARGLSERYRAAVEGHSPWTADVVDPAPIAIPDVLADPTLKALRDVIVAEDIRALAFIPLTHKHRLVGKFMLYYDRVHEFSDDELNTATLVSHYVAFGLDRARADVVSKELFERERTARRDAEAASRAKDEFLATVAHELRNPLGAVVNAVSILDHTATDEPMAAMARAVIHRQTAHLSRLLDDLLDAARFARGRIEIQRVPVDLRALTARSLEQQSHRIEEKQQNLALSLPPEPIVVLGDADRLQQAIGNLLDNASKYTPIGGSISLTLTAEGSEAVLRVSDNGPGVPPDKVEAIFDLFTQVNPTLARTSGGLGIGLSLVRRIVELHIGTVQARSGGPGAEFTVRLPITSVRLQPDMSPEAKEAPPRRIVVIEDNADEREALVTALRLLGCDVRAGATGREGMALALSDQPDLVLVDIGLPDVDGYEVARRLRTRLGHDVQLVALTGYGQEADRRRSAEAGFDAHLVKPIVGEDVLRLTRTSLPRRSSGPPA
jgi:signal transduction histidine kinase/CheY-like chemotaxis protein